MNPIVKFIISSLAVYFTAWLLPGVAIDDYFTALGVALVLGLLNLFVKPILILFTLPATVLTLGLFLLVINAVVILIADKLVTEFRVDGFLWALVFSVVLSFVTGLLERLGKDSNPPKQY